MSVWCTGQCGVGVQELQELLLMLIRPTHQPPGITVLALDAA